MIGFVLLCVFQRKILENLKKELTIELIIFMGEGLTFITEIEDRGSLLSREHHLLDEW